jgi:glycosyltransferase involved in cell wall biosynthesis
VTRVLLIHQPVDGGVARHVVDLADGLQQRGYEPVTCGPAVPSPSSLADAAPSTAAHVRLPMERTVAPMADLAALRQYSQIVRAVAPDVVHAHSSKAGAIARLGRVLHPRVPVIYTPHGYAFAGFFENELERIAYRQAERALAKLTSFVIAVCGAEAELACTVGPVKRVRVVHNGIDGAPAGAADARVLELAQRGPVICTLTQLRPGKGVETLIDAIPRVLAHDPQVQVALVGDGPLRDALIARAGSAGVAHAVHFLGEHGDPLAVLRAADLFVLPSWAEAFPYVILEAMSVGLPIVSTRVGGIPEALTDRATALVVPPREPVAMSRALVELLADRELRMRLGDAATRMVTKFSRARMVDGVTGVYKEALRRRRPKS